MYICVDSGYNIFNLRRNAQTVYSCFLWTIEFPPRTAKNRVFVYKVDKKVSKISACSAMCIRGNSGQFPPPHKARFGFLEKFYVDMYISKLSTAFISLVTESYKHEPVCKNTSSTNA